MVFAKIKKQSVLRNTEKLWPKAKKGIFSKKRNIFSIAIVMISLFWDCWRSFFFWFGNKKLKLKYCKIANCLKAILPALEFGVLLSLFWWLWLSCFCSYSWLCSGSFSWFYFWPSLGSTFYLFGKYNWHDCCFLFGSKNRPASNWKTFQKRTVNSLWRSYQSSRKLAFIFLFFPILPLDILTAAFGLSATTAKKFFLAAGTGYAFYSLVLNFLGDYFGELWFFRSQSNFCFF